MAKSGSLILFWVLVLFGVCLWALEWSRGLIGGRGCIYVEMREWGIAHWW